MKIILISDIHGNAPALQAVLDKEGLNKGYIVLGDIHGLLAYPQKTLRLIDTVDPFVTLLGNHDVSIFRHNEGHVNNRALSRFEYNHTRSALTDEQIFKMRSLPSFREVDSNQVCMTHAMPWPEEASGYEAGNAGVPKSEVTHYASILANAYSTVLLGHTHEQYAVDCSKFGHDILFANPGSLGWDGNYATLDTETKEVELKSVEYDEERVRKHIQIVLPDDAPHTREWY